MAQTRPTTDTAQPTAEALPEQQPQQPEAQQTVITLPPGGGSYRLNDDGTLTPNDTPA